MNVAPQLQSSHFSVPDSLIPLAETYSRSLLEFKLSLEFPVALKGHQVRVPCLTGSIFSGEPPQWICNTVQLEIDKGPAISGFI